MPPVKTLILGVGNILLGDEGVGVYVARKLQELPLPPGVTVLDGGTAGFGLLPYLEGYERIIVVDAVLAGGRPGSICRLSLADLDAGGPGLSLHQADLAWILRLAKAEVTLFAIDLGRTVPGEFTIGLTPPVARAADEVVAMVLAELPARGGGC